jgi:excisionase family DNA binding protein
VNQPEPLLVTIPEAARRLGIGRSTLYELIASGAIETVRIRRARRIPVDALHAYIEGLRRAS